MGTLRLLAKTTKGVLKYQQCVSLGMHRKLYPSMSCRLMSTEPQMSVSSETGVATVKMNRKPVNSLNFDMLTQITITLEKIQNDKSINGVIVTSNIPGIFSAGLDIMEFFNTKERLGEYWRLVQELWLRLYGLHAPTVAAINGHAPAGGCLVALCCDYRIMASGNYKIGLNETQLGIVAPWWFVETMVKTVGHRVAEHALQLGHMFDTGSAHNVGLVDALVDEAKVYDSAVAELTKWHKIPGLKFLPLAYNSRLVLTMSATTGNREAERASQIGLLYDPDSALNVGLIDAVCDSDPNVLLRKANEELNNWLKIPAVPRIITKQYLRKPLIEKLNAGREDDIKNFVDYITRDAVQKMLQEYVANLKKKSDGKK